MSSGRITRELGNRWLALLLGLSGRTHQYPEIRALRRFLSAFAVDCVLDVGANEGQYAAQLRSDVGFSGVILSFEPNPAAFDLLAKRASGDPRWHVFDMALSDFDGTAPFHVMAASQFSSLEQPAEVLDALFSTRNRVERTIAMQCRTLDSLFSELTARYSFTRPFLKMDTQGHDRAVCAGAGAVLAEMLGVQTELAVQPLYTGATDYRDMIAYLDERGFVPSAFFANNKGHFPRLVEMDGIFVNRGQADAHDLAAL